MQCEHEILVKTLAQLPTRGRPLDRREISRELSSIKKTRLKSCASAVFVLAAVRVRTSPVPRGQG